MMRYLCLATSLLLVLLAAAGCSGSSSSPEATQTVSPTPDPAAIVAQASAAIAGVTSFHFKLDHENGTSPMPLDLQLVSAEGDIIVPDKLKATVKTKAGSFDIQVDVTAIGDQTWITNPFTRKWQTLPDATIKDIADPVALVKAVTGGLQNVAYQGTDKVDGVQTQVLTGTLDAGALQNALSFAEPGRSVNVKVWIGTDDHLPRRARIEGPLASGEDNAIVRQIDFSHFNDSSIEITAPQ